MEPRFNELLYNEVLSITNNFLYAPIDVKPAGGRGGGGAGAGHGMGI